MNDVERIEQRLRVAAEETRQLARRRPAPGLVEEPSRVIAPQRGWLAFATAFAVVLVTFGVVPWLAGSIGSEPLGGTSPPPPPTVTSSSEAQIADASCSSGGVPVPGPVDALPAPVSQTRDAIIAAAADCDIATLERLAGENFITSFGGGGADNLRVWEDQGEGQLGTLLHILNMSHSVVGSEDGVTRYVWPAAFTHESWAAIPEEQLGELDAIYTEEELDELSTFGSYAGWRTGIDQDGNWLYFVAGD